jgi:hypothetical protein
MNDSSTARALYWRKPILLPSFPNVACYMSGTLKPCNRFKYIKAHKKGAGICEPLFTVGVAKVRGCSAKESASVCSGAATLPVEAWAVSPQLLGLA